jgi:hypothetical protein
VQTGDTFTVYGDVKLRTFSQPKTPDGNTIFAAADGGVWEEEPPILPTSTGVPTYVDTAGSTYIDTLTGRLWINTDGTGTGWKKVAFDDDIQGQITAASKAALISTNIVWQIPSMPSVGSTEFTIAIPNVTDKDLVFINPDDWIPKGVSIQATAGTNQVQLKAINLTGDRWGTTNQFQLNIGRFLPSSGGPVDIFYQNVAPTTPTEKTIWINSVNSLPYVYSGSRWNGFSGVAFTQPPVAERYIGCLWFDAGKLWAWNGTTWVQLN